MAKRGLSPYTLHYSSATHLLECGALAEVLSPDVYWVRFPAEYVNLLPTKLVEVDSAEEKE
jgi:hypothetical protein